MHRNTKPKIGFASLYLMAAGGILGAGVFTLLPSVISLTGRSAGLAMLAAAVLAALTAVPTIFLSSTIDLPGGFYSQSAVLMPTWLAGINGLMTVLSSLGFGSVGINMALNTVQMFPGLTPMTKMIALGYFALFFFIGIKGSKGTAALQNIMTTTVLIALGIFICGGLPSVQPDFFTSPGFFAGGADGFARAAATLSLCAMGGTQLINFTSQAKNPKRDVPVGMVVSTLSSALIIFLVATVSSGGAAPLEEVVHSGLGAAAERFLSRPLYLFFMIGGALFGLGASLNVAVAVFQYPILQMAKDGWLPKFLIRADNRNNCPYLLMGLAFLIGAVMPVTLDLDILTITSLFSFPGSLLRCFMTLSLLRLPKMFPNRWAASVFHVSQPVLRILVCLSAAASLFLTVCFMGSLTPAALGASTFVLGVLCAYVLWRYKSGHVDVGYIRANFQDIAGESGPNPEYGLAGKLKANS